MADSILRLKVDSQEYDAKIKRAAEGIQQYAQKCREAGGTLEHLDDGVQSFVQALGHMNTVASGTKGQLREMSNALTTLTQVYRGLTDEEKASPFGQELAKGIQQLTERAGSVQDAMADVQASIKHAASDTRLFDQMAQGMSVVTATFQGLTGAAKLFGIESKDNLEVIAKLQAAMAVTNSLTTIQTALQKESALMMGISTIQTKALAAAKALETSNTIAATAAQKAFNVVANANPYVLLASAVLALGAALFSMGNDAKSAAAELERLNHIIDGLNEGMEYSVTVAQQLGKSRREILELRSQYAQLALEESGRELSRQEVRYRNGEISVEDYNRFVDANRKAFDAWNKIQTERTALGTVNRTFENTWQSLNSENEINAAINAFKSLRSEVQLGSDAYKEYSRRIEALQAKLPKTTGRGSGRTNGHSTAVDSVAPVGSIADLNIQLSELRKQQSLVTSTDEWKEYENKIGNVIIRIKELKGELGLQGVGYTATGLLDREDFLRRGNQRISNFKVPTAKEKTEANLTSSMSSIASGFGNITSGLEKLGVDIPKGFEDTINGIQAVCSILTGISAVVSAIQLITAADVIKPFASGGVVKAAGGYRVPGRTFSGDMIPARLNAGELVLNQAQAGVIASALQDRDFGGGSGLMQPYVDGESIFLGMNNTSKRMGRGEIVTTSTLRRLGLT